MIAKIERQQAATHIEEIVRAASGGIMVARGDLGIEVPIEQLPVEQK
ncbi:MAG TPA: pyruvate kinase, partial [Solirubrobacterales bacterium]|nr:pyruvate kinase [Solirubrobacterales bacterium]